MRKVIIYITMLVFLLSSVSAGKITYNLPFSGMSMYPTLKPGTIQVQTYTSDEPILPGDIICYNYDSRCYPNDSSRYICHLVWATTTEHVYTVGINNPYPDTCSVEYKDIAFKVVT